MKAKKITLGRIANHEFNRSLRAFRNSIQPLDMLKMLIAERTKASGVFVRLTGVALVVTLWIANREHSSLLEADLKFLKITIPVIYVSTFVSAMVYGAILHFLSYMVINDFIRILANKWFNTNAPLAIPFDGDNAWNISMIPQFRTLTSSRGHKFNMLVNLVIVTTPVFLILFIIYWHVLSITIHALIGTGIVLAKPLAIVSLLFLLFPIFQIVSFYIPFKFTKNTRFIRWNFLVPMYRRTNQWPPRVEAWMEERPK